MLSWIVVIQGRSRCESWCIMLGTVVVNQVYYAESVVVSHGVLCWASSCASWCVILCHWLSIMVWCALPVVRYGVLCWASGCEWWCTMLSQWLLITCVMLSQWVWFMVCFAEAVVVDQGEKWGDSGSESWWVVLNNSLWIRFVMLNQWVVNHGVLCWASGC